MELNARYFLDTNVIIYLLNNQLAEPLPAGHYSVSIITEIELLSFSGLTAGEEKSVRDLLTELEQIPLSSDTLKNKTIQLRRANSIKLPDAVIAASAIINNSVLLTNDKVFNGIEGLKYRSLRLLDDEQ